MSHDCTRAIIDLDAVSSNFDAVCRKAKVPVMAVIKADAYGHGAVPIARLHRRKPSPTPSAWGSAPPFSAGRTGKPCPGLPWKRGYPQPFTLPWTRA